MVDRTSSFAAVLSVVFVLAVGCGGEQTQPANAQVLTLPSTPPPSASVVADAGSTPQTNTMEGQVIDNTEPPSAPPSSTWGASIHSASSPPPDAGARQKPPTIHVSTSTVSTGLPPEVIQRIVRQSFGRFRLCYELGLHKDPTLAGRVTIKFIIDSTGAVAQANKTSSTTLADADVVRCVVRAFGNLSFPQPSAGSVDVVYPIEFAP